MQPMKLNRSSLFWLAFILLGLLLLATLSLQGHHDVAIAAGRGHVEAGADPSEPGQVVSPPPVLVPILLYHYLTEEDTSSSPYYVPRDQFERQMKALKVYGYETISLQDFFAYRAGTGVLPPRPVIVTFGDAHPSVHTIARPIMNSLDMQLTFFVTTDWITEDGHYNSLTWDNLAQFLSEGHHIESHSLSHTDLSNLSAADAWQEILGSRLAIEGRLGHQVRYFSYPYGGGALDPDIQAMVRDAGYQAAVNARPYEHANTAESDIWALPRLAIGPEHSVDVDHDRLLYFFMRQVQGGFPVPTITIDRWRAEGSESGPGGCSVAGETVTIEVDVTNHGFATEFQVVLRLDQDDDHDEVYFQKVIDGYLTRGQSATYTFTVVLDKSLGYGSLGQTIQIMDQYGVLGYASKDWAPGLLFSEVCHQVQLPAVQR